MIHYDEPYTLRRDTLLEGEPVPAMAVMLSEQERTLFGFRWPRSGKPPTITSARGFVLFFTEPRFDADAAARALKAVEAAERLYAPDDPNHSYTFYDAVVLTAAPLESDAAKAIRRYRLRRDYKDGWGLIRVAVVDVEARTAVCSKDAKDLGRMILQRLAGES